MNLTTEEINSLINHSGKVKEAFKIWNEEKNTKKKREIIKSICSKLDKKEFIPILKNIINGGNPFSTLVKLDFEDDCLYFSPFFWNVHKKNLESQGKLVISAENREYELLYCSFYWLFPGQQKFPPRNYPCFMINGKNLKIKINSLLVDLFEDDKEICIFSLGNRTCLFKTEDLKDVLELASLSTDKFEILKIQRNE